jgi:hypothetical protein
MVIFSSKFTEKKMKLRVENMVLVVTMTLASSSSFYEQTGRPIYFSLCGWNSWYAPVGHTLGNSWRINGDCNPWSTIVAAILFVSPCFFVIHCYFKYAKRFNTLCSAVRQIGEQCGNFIVTVRNISFFVQVSSSTYCKQTDSSYYLTC